MPERIFDFCRNEEILSLNSSSWLVGIISIFLPSERHVNATTTDRAGRTPLVGEHRTHAPHVHTSKPPLNSVEEKIRLRKRKSVLGIQDSSSQGLSTLWQRRHNRRRQRRLAAGEVHFPAHFLALASRHSLAKFSETGNRDIFDNRLCGFWSLTLFESSRGGEINI